jgi:hypothetical protein
MQQNRYKHIHIRTKRKFFTLFQMKPYIELQRSNMKKPKQNNFNRSRFYKPRSTNRSNRSIKDVPRSIHKRKSPKSIEIQIGFAGRRGGAGIRRLSVQVAGTPTPHRAPPLLLARRGRWRRLVGDTGRPSQWTMRPPIEGGRRPSEDEADCRRTAQAIGGRGRPLEAHGLLPRWSSNVGGRP